MGGNPRCILVVVGSIDNQQVAVLTQTVGNQVIHNAALVVAHRAVADLAVLHVAEIVGQQHLDVVQGVRSGEDDFAHVGDIEQSRLFSDSHVFCDNTGTVLNRQQVAGKGDDLAAQGNVTVIQRGLTFHKNALL